VIGLVGPLQGQVAAAQQVGGLPRPRVPSTPARWRKELPLGAAAARTGKAECHVVGGHQSGLGDVQQPSGWRSPPPPESKNRRSAAI